MQSISVLKVITNACKGIAGYTIYSGSVIIKNLEP
jgi:hypothetical protein